MIALVCTTDGRRSCISRAIPSAVDQLHGPVTDLIISDDSADPDYQSWLIRFFPDWTVICGNKREGFGGNIRRAWNYLRNETTAQYIFCIEDDFVFRKPVYLRPMIEVLDAQPHLAQLVLKRQPWNTDEKRAGGIIEQHPIDYAEMRDGEGRTWVEHRRFFSTNPYLARRSLLDWQWPDGSESEGHFTHLLLKLWPGVRFAFWGGLSDEPLVEHIGTERIGTGY